jgi:hypothetical protein
MVALGQDSMLSILAPWILVVGGVAAYWWIVEGEAKYKRKRRRY